MSKRNARLSLTKNGAYLLFSLLLSLAPVYSQRARGVDKTLEEVMLIQALHEGELFRIPGVNGMGIGKDEKGELVLHVYIKEAANLSLIPKILDDVQIEPIASSDFVPLDTCDPPPQPMCPRPGGCTHRNRYPFPVPGGISTSNHLSCCYNTGTRSFKVCDARDTAIVGYITNNHVAARGPDGCPNRAGMGTPQFQPGNWDVPSCTDGAQIGTIQRVHAINFQGENRVDATFVRSDGATVSDMILDIGTPTTMYRTPIMDENVVKSGSTTGWTEGSVQSINMTVRIDYGLACGGTADFTGQIVVTPGRFSASGDSGSPVLDLSNNPIGLLFAGDDAQTLVNPMEDVLMTLRVNFCECTLPPANLVSWWPGEGDASDIIGDNPGTPVGGVDFVDGIVGQAFRFNGVDGFVAMGRTVLGTTGPFTIEAWINPSDITFFHIIVSEIGIENREGQYQFRINPHPLFRFGQPGGQLNFFRRTGSGIDVFLVETVDPIPVQVWTHVAAVFNGGTDLKIFINGVQASTTSFPTRYVGTSPVQTLIGVNDQNGEFFNGLMDEVSIYNRALTEREIRSIYIAGAQGKCQPKSGNGL